MGHFSSITKILHVELIYSIYLTTDSSNNILSIVDYIFPEVSWSSKFDMFNLLSLPRQNISHKKGHNDENNN
jgi:hypothetical protein